MASLNFMVSSPQSTEPCDGSTSGHKLHKWIPVEQTKALPGRNYSVTFWCRVCGRRHNEVYDEKTFKMYQTLIEGGNK